MACCAGPPRYGVIRPQGVDLARGAATSRRTRARPHEGHPRRPAGLEALIGQMRVAAAGAALHTLAGQHPLCGAWPRAAATISTMRVSMGGPPRAEKQDRCCTPARIIVATAGVSLRRSLAPGRLAQLQHQFPVDRAQTPLTGHVRPPAHHEGAPLAVAPPLATGGLLQIGEPSMDELQHHGPPSPRSGPHECGHLTDLPGPRLPWSVPRGSPLQGAVF